MASKQEVPTERVQTDNTWIIEDGSVSGLTQEKQHSKEGDARVQVGQVVLPQIWHKQED